MYELLDFLSVMLPERSEPDPVIQETVHNCSY